MAELKSYSAKTHQGPYLQLNEDGVEVDLVNNLFMLLDGFGGSNAGDKAVQNLKENIKKFYTRIGGDPDATMPFSYSPKYLVEGNALLNSMYYSHGILHQENAEKSMGERGGASAIVGALAENILTIANTGNTKGYLFRKGDLNVTCLPDNMENLSPDPYQKAFHTTPMSGFGLFDELHLFITEIRVVKDDLVLFLSDGVYARLDGHEIRYILQKDKLTQSEKIEELFSLANSRGNLDNQSAVFIQF